MKEILLQGEGIVKQFPGGTDLVLDHVDLAVYQGDFTIVMGPSGAGKSTLLYALSGMDTISEGRVIYKEQEITRLKEAQMAKLRSREFGFVFQQTHLVSNLTLFENVAVAGYLNRGVSGKDTQERASSLLSQMNVNGARNRMPNQTSGGEAQRAAIARAMINEPGILFADEPTGALNKRNTDEVLSLLTELNQKGQSILMVTHDVRAAIRGNRILYLEDGKILDEMALPPFTQETARERKETVSAWLTSLAW